MGKKKRTRASNGMGSIRQRPDKRWEARYTAPDGSQKSIYGKTEREVTAKLRGKLHDIDNGTWREPSNLTVKGWLDIWLTDYQANTTDRTVNKDKCIFERHFHPIIGMVKLAAFSDIHVQRMLSALRSKGLAESTIKNYMSIFESAMNQAVRSKLIHNNPAVELHLSNARIKEFHIIDKAMLPAFFDAASATRYPIELKFCILTGLRIGELRGLRWIDTDLDIGTLNIRQQLKPKYKGMSRITLPKYKKKRLFYIPEEAVDLLRQQRKRQAEDRIAAGEKWHDDELSQGLVFRQRNGKCHGEHTILYAVRAVGRAIGIPDLHPHDLRHSYAVAALRSGMDVKTLQHNLGHASTRMTLDVYAAYTEDAGKEGASMLSSYLKNTQK